MGTKLYKEPQEKKYEDFGERLKKARKCKYKNQQEFADAIDKKVETVRNWEQGRILPEMGTLFKICDTLDCDLDYLIGRLEDRNRTIKEMAAYTGLSESAIRIMHRCSSSDNRSNRWSDFLSFVICHDDFPSLMNNISDFVIIFDSKYQNTIEDLNHGVLDMTAAGLFYISHTMSNIVEDLGSHECSHERSSE